MTKIGFHRKLLFQYYFYDSNTVPYFKREWVSFLTKKNPQGTYAMNIRKNTGTLLQCVAAYWQVNDLMWVTRGINRELIIRENDSNLQVKG